MAHRCGVTFNPFALHTSLICCCVSFMEFLIYVLTKQEQPLSYSLFKVDQQNDCPTGRAIIGHVESPPDHSLLQTLLGTEIFRELDGPRPAPSFPPTALPAKQQHNRLQRAFGKPATPAPLIALEIGRASCRERV